MENNQSFINMLFTVDQNMSKLSIYELNRLYEFNGVERTFKRIKRANQFLGNLHICRLIILYGEGRKNVLKNLELVKRVAIACGDEYSYREYLIRTFGINRGDIACLDRLEYSRMIGNYDIVRYRLLKSEITFGNITVKAAETNLKVYKNGKYVGDYSRFMGIQVYDGVLHIGVLYRDSETSCRRTIYGLKLVNSKLVICSEESHMGKYEGDYTLNEISLGINW